MVWWKDLKTLNLSIFDSDESKNGEKQKQTKKSKNIRIFSIFYVAAMALKTLKKKLNLL